MLEPIKNQTKSGIKTDPLLLTGLKNLVNVLPRGKGLLPRLFGGIFASYFSKYAVNTRHGARLKIASGSLDFYTTMLNQDRSFDYWVFDTCHSFIKPDDVFYDIGANVGYMSIEMAQCTNEKDIQIYSFEAQQELAFNVAASADLNKFSNVNVFYCALTDQVGTVSFVNEAHSIHGHISKSADNTSKSVTVDAYTVDFLVEKSIIEPPNVVKIDVEGAEHKVLLGMREVIKQYKPVVVFEISQDTYDFDTTPREIIDYLSELAAYKFFWAAGSYRKEIELTEEDLNKHYTNNKNILCYVN